MHVVLLDAESKPLTEDLFRRIQTGPVSKLFTLHFRLGNYSIVRNKGHYVGTYTNHDVTVIVPPSFSGNSFIDLLLYSSGLDTKSFLERPLVPTAISRNSDNIFFLDLLIAILISATRQALRRGPARIYEVREERTQVIVGRPIWQSTFGKHFSQGIVCRCAQIETDNELNRHLLAGLRAAVSLSNNQELKVQASELLSIWKSIANETHVTMSSIDSTIRKVSPITAHYELPLMISKALLFGFYPSDVFSSGVNRLQTLEFYLPTIFERAVERLLKDSAVDMGYRVRPQFTHTKVLTNGYGESYRSVRPDLLISIDAEPIAIVDVKFKPRYMKAPHTHEKEIENRVSSADIYQLSFYQAAIQQQYGLAKPPRAFIAAPIFDSSALLSHLSYRTVTWNANVFGGDELGFKVLGFDIEGLSANLRTTTGSALLKAVAPELFESLTRICGDVPVDSNVHDRQDLEQPPL